MRIGRIRVVVIAFVLVCSSQALTATRQLFALRDDAHVTPVAGESWLVHLNRSFGDTSMGKTWRLGPGAEEEGSLAPPPQAPIYFYSSGEEVTLHGDDLYRLNCQGCHGESGAGAPPEINSVINPVRATSVPLILARVKSIGMDLTHADALKLAQQSNAALLDRLQKGGENMPAFPQLSGAEKRALVAYLKYLAGVPGATRETPGVKESQVRVGELIVKSTCHTCHSAIGPNPGPRDLMEGAIPPLCVLSARKNGSEFIRKVTQGAPVLMGNPPMLFRGRMPVFFYLSEDEAADVYLYLTLYPPSEHSTDGRLVAASQVVRPRSTGGGGSPLPAVALRDVASEDSQSPNTAGLSTAAFSLVIALVTAMLAGGVAFTYREFKRLSADSAGRAATAGARSIGPATLGQMTSALRTARPLQYGTAKRSSR